MKNKNIIMKHRIRAAGIIVVDDKIMLLKHKHANYKYWAPPGGGLEEIDTSTKATVKREVFEESGLTAEVGPLMFIKEFFEKSSNIYHVEQYYLINSVQGEVSLKNIANTQNTEHLITEIKWFTRAELQSIKVFPEQLKNLLWDKLKEQQISPVNLGVEVAD